MHTISLLYCELLDFFSLLSYQNIRKGVILLIPILSYLLEVLCVILIEMRPKQNES